MRFRVIPLPAHLDWDELDTALPDRFLDGSGMHPQIANELLSAIASAVEAGYRLKAYKLHPSDPNDGELDTPLKAFVRKYLYKTNFEDRDQRPEQVDELSAMVLFSKFGTEPTIFDSDTNASTPQDPELLSTMAATGKALSELEAMLQKIEAELRIPDDFMPELDGIADDLRESMWQSRHVDRFAQPLEDLDELYLGGDDDGGLLEVLRMARERRSEQQGHGTNIPGNIRVEIFDLAVQGVKSVDFTPHHKPGDSALIEFLRADAANHFGGQMTTFEKLTARFNVESIDRISIQIEAFPRGGRPEVPDFIQRLEKMLREEADVDVKVVDLRTHSGPQGLDDTIREMLGRMQSPPTNQSRRGMSRDDAELIGLKGRKPEKQTQQIKTEDLFTDVKTVLDDERLKRNATIWLTDLGTNVAMNLLNQLAGMFLAMLTFPFRWAWNRVLKPVLYLVWVLISAFTITLAAVTWSIMTIMTFVNVPVWYYFTMTDRPFSAAYFSTLMGWGIWAVANFLFGVATGLKPKFNSRVYPPEHIPSRDIILAGVRVRRWMHRSWVSIANTPRQMWEVLTHVGNIRERALYDFKPYDYNWLVRKTAHTWDWFDDRKLDLEAVKEVFANPDEAEYALREPIQDPWIVLQSARLGLWLRNTVEELSRRLDAAFDPDYRTHILESENIYDPEYVKAAKIGQKISYRRDKFLSEWVKFASHTELDSFLLTIRSASHRKWLAKQTDPLTFWPEKVALGISSVFETLANLARRFGELIEVQRYEFEKDNEGPEDLYTAHIHDIEWMENLGRKAKENQDLDH